MKKCDLLSGINGACLHVYRAYQRPNKCTPTSCPKHKYRYYISHRKTMSYIWKHLLDDKGFVDCPDFEASIRGKGHIEEANRICAILNKMENR